MSIPGASGAGEFEVYTWRRIPVALSPWFFLLVVLVFWRDRSPVTATLTVLVFAASVLLHEYGHAFMAKRYGLMPRIVLHAFGGWCEHRTAPTRRKAFFVSAAGPAVTLLLAAGGWVLSELVQDRAGSLVAFALYLTAHINAFLAVLNLLPILPLDGGTMFHHALAWFAPQNRADGMAYWTGVVLAVVLCGIGLLNGDFFIAILFGMFAFQNANQAQPFDIVNSFVAKRKQAPANRLGIGYPVSRTIWSIAAFTVVSWLSTSLLSTPSERLALLVQPDLLSTGHVWTLVTHVFIYAPWDWGPLLFTLFALGAFAPIVQKRIGAMGLGALYAAATVMGVITAIFLPSLLAQSVEGLPPMLGPQRIVAGAVAPNTALLVAWALTAPNRPTFFTPLTPRMWTALAFVGGILASLFLTGWAWMPAVGGALVGLAVLAFAKPDLATH